MSYTSRLRHRLLIKHPAPAATADSTGQLFVDETGQPIGDSTSTNADDWSNAVEVRGLVQERTARWPDGPGTGAELVDTRIFLEADVVISELDKVKRTDVDPPQVYQAEFVNRFTGYGKLSHTEVQARRLPL